MCTWRPCARVPDRGKCTWPWPVTGCRMSTPWEQLISSTMTPTTAVAVKLAVTDEPPEPTDPNGAVLAGSSAGCSGTSGSGIFGNLHRHIPLLSRLSLNKTDKPPCRSVLLYRALTNHCLRSYIRIYIYIYTSQLFKTIGTYLNV